MGTNSNDKSNINGYVIPIPTGNVCFTVGGNEKNYCGCGHFNGYRSRFCKQCVEVRLRSPFSTKIDDDYNDEIVNDVVGNICTVCNRERYELRDMSKDEYIYCTGGPPEIS